MDSTNILKIDGSYGEGGGQIVRTAVTLSAITKIPVIITNIRAKRPERGLKAQHITAVSALKELCNAKVIGLQKNSTTLEFYPQNIIHKEFKFDIGTAGSTTLVLQSFILAGIFARGPVKLELTGGTDVRWAPQIDYIKNVFLRLIDKLGIKVHLDVLLRGYYPKGGGKIVAKITNCEKIMPLWMEYKPASKISCCVNISKTLPMHILERIKNTIVHKLSNYDYEIKEDVCDTYSPGVGLVLYTDTLIGASGLGEKSLSAEKLSENVIADLIAEINSNATLDIHAVDQMLPYFALANGHSRFTCRELSLHAKTLLWLLEKFLDIKYEIEKKHNYIDVKIGRIIK